MQRTAPAAHALRYTQCIMHIHANKKPVINPRYSLFHSHLPGFNHLSKVYNVHATCCYVKERPFCNCVCVFVQQSCYACFFPPFIFLRVFFFHRFASFTLPAVKYLHKIHFLTILFQFSRRIVLSIIFCCLDFHFSSSISCSPFLLFLLCRKLAAVS